MPTLKVLAAALKITGLIVPSTSNTPLGAMEPIPTLPPSMIRIAFIVPIPTLPD